MRLSVRTVPPNAHRHALQPYDSLLQVMPREPLLTVAVRSIGRRSVVDVRGEIDVSTGPELAAALDRTLAAGAAQIWVDLTETTFMDSTGLHVLGELRDRVVELNRRLAVICPDGPVRRALEVSGLAGMLPLHASRAAAQREA